MYIQYERETESYALAQVKGCGTRKQKRLQ